MWTISEEDYFSPEPEYALKIEQSSFGGSFLLPEGAVCVETKRRTDM